MEQRTNKQVTDIIDYIKDNYWNLSIVEEDVLDSFLILFSAQNIKEIKKVEHLLNDETEELLKSLDKGDIKEYVKDYLNMVDEDDIEDCKDLDEYDDYEIIGEFYRRDLDRFGNSRYDIVTQSDLEEMTELFLNLSQQKRSEIINNLKNV